MKYLADHFFFKNEQDLSEALCKRALSYCERLKRPESSDIQSFRKEVCLLKSDLHFIYGKSLHKSEKYDQALAHYFKSVEFNPQNYAAHFCLAKLHFLNGNINAVDESLNKILSVQKFKDSYEAINLLAKVKTLQGKRFEALVLYKKLIEINPNDYISCLNIA